LKKLVFSTIGLLALTLILASWGSTGHRKISEAAALSFNEQMQGFHAWIGFLSDHASDADYRKATDPTEGPKHYIDIDNYPEFIAIGRIPQTFDSAVNIHGSAFVFDNGILPWATMASFDSLRNCMQRGDFEHAQIYAADLGHYVADGHMPMHVTRNYNGQFTGNTGIHSRYESAMINAFIDQFVYEGGMAMEISDVNQYVFDYLYVNCMLVDSILAADDYAKSLSSNYSSSTYKNALWDKSKSFTIPLFERASHALANLIYTAWVQAGSPSLSAAGVNDPLSVSNSVLEQNSPNPFHSTTHFVYTVKETSRVFLHVRDMNGDVLDTIVDGTLPAGKYSGDWEATSHPAGIYYLVLNTGKFVHVKKMVFLGD
jgi:hypothetical protein